MYKQKEWEQRIEKASPGLFDFLVTVLLGLVITLVLVLVVAVLLYLGFIVAVYEEGVQPDAVQGIPFLALALDLFGRDELTSTDASLLEFVLSTTLPVFGLTAAAAFGWLVRILQGVASGWTQWRKPNLIHAFRTVLDNLYYSGKFHALAAVHLSQWRTQDGYGIRILDTPSRETSATWPAHIFGKYNSADSTVQGIVSKDSSKSKKIQGLAKRMCGVLSSNPSGRSPLEIVDAYEHAVGIAHLRCLVQATLILAGIFLLACTFALISAEAGLPISARAILVVLIAVVGWYLKRFLVPSEKVYSRVYGLDANQEIGILQMSVEGHLKRMVIAFAIVNLVLALIL